MSLKAFTLIEVIVAVAILGILVAILMPMFGNHNIQSKEAAARDILHKMRGQISLYTFEHKGVAPGYIISPTGLATQATLTKLYNQFIGTSAISGDAVSSRTPSGIYVYGPYMDKLPVNPFNKLSTIKYVPVLTTFSNAADETTGWLYKKETSEFKLNWKRPDSEGNSYIDY